MILNFKGKRITDIISVVPSTISKYEDEIENYSFSRAKCMKLKDIMGFDEHRIASQNVTASDLCEFAFNHLVDNKGLQRDTIDAMIFVTHTPDHFIPPTSSILHGKLGLKEDCLCFDINHGCAGFIIGLQQAFMLLEQQGINKVALLNGDTLSRKINKKDRNSYPVIGDAGAVTIIENNEDVNDIKIFTKNRGKDAMVLKIPAGGFRMPSSDETAKDVDMGDGNYRSLDNLNMEGASVFSFVQLEVPKMIVEILEANQLSKDDIDSYMFHQPNKFMLEKLADKIEVPREKMPNNIVEIYGNSNSVTIPVNITHNLGKELVSDKKLKLCMAGFGVGLTWASMVIDMGNLNSCELIEYKE
jgi:3-oxoacyl-[acyl-carrier-protein] synthase-3